MGYHYKLAVSVIFLLSISSLQFFLNLRNLDQFYQFQRQRRRDSLNWNIEERTNSSRIREKNVFVIILCDGNITSKLERKHHKPGEQMKQATTMIKSAVFFTSETLRFIVITDTHKLFVDLQNNLKENLNQNYLKKVVLEPHRIWYPENRKELRDLYRPCATERLFLSELLPYDSVIYIDTDVLFLRPPEQLWHEFEYFGKTEMAALSPTLSRHYATMSQVPFYGKRGLNAGIMPMNLTRMDNFPGGWTDTLMEIWDNYKEMILLADQDILNILFSEYPYYLYDLSCDWNFVGHGCFENSSLCVDAHKYGISIIHGNGNMFHRNKFLYFKVVYKMWEHFPIHETVDFFWATMKERMKNIDPSECPKYRNLSELILKRRPLEKDEDLLKAQKNLTHTPLL